MEALARIYLKRGNEFIDWLRLSHSIEIGFWSAYASSFFQQYTHYWKQDLLGLGGKNNYCVKNNFGILRGPLIHNYGAIKMIYTIISFCFNILINMLRWLKKWSKNKKLLSITKFSGSQYCFDFYCFQFNFVILIILLVIELCI